MINNIDNSVYNHNYNINNNNSININNNNIFNNINPITCNNKYLFNYISLNNSMEDILNSKSIGKMKKISNRTTRRILNDKFKESIGFKTKIINICKRMKKNKKKNKKKKNIISFDNNKSLDNNNSKEKIKTLLNNCKNSISKNKKIKQINLNKADKFNKFRELSSSEDSSKKKNHFNNKSLTKKAENLKNDSEIFNREEIAKSLRYSRNSNIYPFIKEKKSIVDFLVFLKILNSKPLKRIW